MRVALFCRDKPDSLPLRLANRDAHRAHIDRSGVVEMAGPLLDESGSMAGSLIVLSVATMAEARAWTDADPYAQAGLFESVQLAEWNKVVG